MITKLFAFRKGVRNFQPARPINHCGWGYILCEPFQPRSRYNCILTRLLVHKGRATGNAVAVLKSTYSYSSAAHFRNLFDSYASLRTTSSTLLPARLPHSLKILKILHLYVGRRRHRSVQLKWNQYNGIDEIKIFNSWSR